MDSGGEAAWSSPHWQGRREHHRDHGGRGGGQGGGRHGQRDGHGEFYRNQYGDRHEQQGQFRGDRGNYHRGPPPGRRQQGSFGQLREGYQQAGPQNPMYPHAAQQPLPGFRPDPGAPYDVHSGPAGPERPAGFVLFPADPQAMMGVPRPEFWAGPTAAAAAAGFPSPHAAAPLAPAPFVRAAFPREPPPMPYPQPYMPAHAGGAGMHAHPGMRTQNTGMGSISGPGGVAPAMQGAGFHYGPARPMQHGGGIAAGGNAPRGAGPGGPGAMQRGNDNYRGPHGGAGGGGGTAASRTKGVRVPPVPQPLINAPGGPADQGSSGMNSLGRLRQQPPSGVANVQAARAAAPEAPAVVVGPTPGNGATGSGQTGTENGSRVPPSSVPPSGISDLQAAPPVGVTAGPGDATGTLAGATAEAGMPAPVPAIAAVAAPAVEPQAPHAVPGAVQPEPIMHGVAHGPGASASVGPGTTPAGTNLEPAVHREISHDGGGPAAAPVLPPDPPSGWVPPGPPAPAAPPAAPAAPAAPVNAVDAVAMAAAPTAAPAPSDSPSTRESSSGGGGGSAWKQGPATALFSPATAAVASTAPSSSHPPARRPGRGPGALHSAVGPPPGYGAPPVSTAPLPVAVAPLPAAAVALPTAAASTAATAANNALTGPSAPPAADEACTAAAAAAAALTQHPAPASAQAPAAAMPAAAAVVASAAAARAPLGAPGFPVRENHRPAPVSPPPGFGPSTPPSTAAGSPTPAAGVTSWAKLAAAAQGGPARRTNSGGGSAPDAAAAHRQQHSHRAAPGAAVQAGSSHATPGPVPPEHEPAQGPPVVAPGTAAVADGGVPSAQTAAAASAPASALAAPPSVAVTEAVSHSGPAPGPAAEIAAAKEAAPSPTPDAVATTSALAADKAVTVPHTATAGAGAAAGGPAAQAADALSSASTGAGAAPAATPEQSPPTDAPQEASGAVAAAPVAAPEPAVPGVAADAAAQPQAESAVPESPGAPEPAPAVFSSWAKIAAAKTTAAPPAHGLSHARQGHHAAPGSVASPSRGKAAGTHGRHGAGGRGPGVAQRIAVSALPPDSMFPQRHPAPPPPVGASTEHTAPDAAPAPASAGPAPPPAAGAPHGAAAERAAAQPGEPEAGAPAELVEGDDDGGDSWHIAPAHKRGGRAAHPPQAGAAAPAHGHAQTGHRDHGHAKDQQSHPPAAGRGRGRHGGEPHQAPHGHGPGVVSQQPGGRGKATGSASGLAAAPGSCPQQQQQQHKQEQQQSHAKPAVPEQPAAPAAVLVPAPAHAAAAPEPEQVSAPGPQEAPLPSADTAAMTVEAPAPAAPSINAAAAPADAGTAAAQPGEGAGALPSDEAQQPVAAVPVAVAVAVEAVHGPPAAVPPAEAAEAVELPSAVPTSVGAAAGEEPAATQGPAAAAGDETDAEAKVKGIEAVAAAASQPKQDAAAATAAPGTQQQQPAGKKGKKSAAGKAATAAAPPAAAKAAEKPDDDEDEAERAAASIPAGSNRWDLLGSAGEEDGEDGAVTVATAAAAASGEDGAAAADVDLTAALRQLLAPESVEQLLQLPGRQAVDRVIQPRGLTNTGNTCFINSTLQALLACGPFASVMARLPAVLPLLEPGKSPTLYGLALFSAELTTAPAGAGAGSAAGGGVPGAPGAGGQGEGQAVEEEGWAEVPVHRGKKGSTRKSTSAYPALHAHSVQPQQPQHPAAAGAPTASGAASGPGGAQAGGPGASASLGVVLGGRPLVPSMLNGIVAAFNPRISIASAPVASHAGPKPSMAQMLSKGRGGHLGDQQQQQEQQDAQEFFQFLVNRAHEEVVALRKAHGLATSAQAGAGAGAGDKAGAADTAGDADGDEWAQVGRKNKATVTRQVGAPADDASSRSPVSAIFSGLLKSTIRFQQPHAHYKPSATIEAFNMLHLDIAGEGVATLEDGLRHHSVPESIEYKPDGAPSMLPAKKDVRLYRLPECLVLHLKRFTYTAAGGGGYTKLHKAVAFGASLRLEGKVLAEDCPDRSNSEYRLVATVVHHGRSIAGGHYTADVLQPDGRWLRFNDAVVDLVPEAAVLAERPYLLFYQRVSSPPQQQQTRG